MGGLKIVLAEHDVKPTCPSCEKTQVSAPFRKILDFSLGCGLEKP